MLSIRNGLGGRFKRGSGDNGVMRGLLRGESNGIVIPFRREKIDQRSSAFLVSKLDGLADLI